MSREFATIGGGCFWGIEHLYREIPGVFDAVSGYEAGELENPTYRDVCTGRTGHAEVVRVEFDPDVVSYKELLHAFWEMHDPTTLNRQGPDVGTQYRSIILTHSEDQRIQEEESKAWAQQFFKRPIVTTIEPSTTFYPAEDYHQRYLERTGRAACHVRHKIGR